MIAVPTDAETRKLVNSHVTPVCEAPMSAWIAPSAGTTVELSRA
jgi:hypothetical protein